MGHQTRNGNGRRQSFYGLFNHVRFEHLLAGVSGGVTSTLVLHPLDLLKIRFAVNDGHLSVRPQYNGLVNAVTSIFREEGIRGFYRGVTPNCWGAGTAWGCYFLFYDSIKTWLLEGNSTRQLGPGKHMLAAAEAGFLTLIITNPIWVVKTRMCLQCAGVDMNVPAYKRYSSMVDGLAKVYRYEGVGGLYKGFVPGMFGVSHGALQFMAYEEMKKLYIRHYNLCPDRHLTTVEYLTIAALSKLFAASVTYPYQVLRARLQDQFTDYKGLIDVISKTWRYERLRGFYKGLSAYLLHVTPNICIVFLMYEKITAPREKEDLTLVTCEEDTR